MLFFQANGGTIFLPATKQPIKCLAQVHNNDSTIDVPQTSNPLIPTLNTQPTATAPPFLQTAHKVIGTRPRNSYHGKLGILLIIS